LIAILEKTNTKMRKLREIKNCLIAENQKEKEAVKN